MWEPKFSVLMESPIFATSNTFVNRQKNRLGRMSFCSILGQTNFEIFLSSTLSSVLIEEYTSGERRVQA